MAFTYQNPVYDGYFADPFVLQVGGDYYAYGTGTGLDRDAAGEPRAFTVLHSRDLRQWRRLGGALVPPPGTLQHSFWAPEVAERDGRYFLYYSSAPAGHDEQHRIHVAMAERPEGPFFVQNVLLPDEGFCIDAHPFHDVKDDRWYLFLAKDYFSGRTGTGLAVVPLGPDMVRPAGAAREMLRANADWQVYQRNRPLYGQEWQAWHTVEGPCVVAHAGRYYCFYSGGNWQTAEYGVSYAVADHPLGPWEHAPENEPVVLRGRPPHVLGPGHNSYARAPDGTELLVYHAWDEHATARRMCVDPLVWTEAGPRCLGPTLGLVDESVASR